MKIFDSFIFYNELDLLYYRLSILDPYVDKFILVEATYTFTGLPKPLYYSENKDMFSKFNNKICHIIVDDFPYKHPNINHAAGQAWQNEYHQRNSISRGISQLKDIIDPFDIILTSDVDEIPNPLILKNALEDILLYDKSYLNRLALDMYYYNLHFRIGEGSNWHGIKLFTYFAYQKNRLSFQDMRTWEHSHFVPIISNGGWHLSYFGDIQFIIKKIASFSHTEYNNEKYISEELLIEKIKSGINLLNDTSLIFIPINSNTNLPPQYNIYLTKYYNTNYL